MIAKYPRDGLELASVEDAVGFHVGFVLPCGCAGLLHVLGQGASFVCPVLEIVGENRSVARDETGAQTGQAGTLGKAVKRDASRVVVAAGPMRDLQQAGRWARVVRIDLRVALVGGNHEVVPVGLLEQPDDGLCRDRLAGGVARRAQVDDLASAPDAVRHASEIRLVAVFPSAVDVVGHAVAEQRCPFVDLVERVRHQHPGAGVAAEDGLAEGKQRFPGPGHWQDLGFWIELDSVAPCHPAADRFPQLRGSSRGGIGTQTGLQPVGVAQQVDHELRRCMFRLADREGDVRELGVTRNAGEKAGQSLEGICLQSVQVGVHAGSGSGDLPVETLSQGVFEEVNGLFVRDRPTLPAADLEHVLYPLAQGGDARADDR